MVKEIESAQGGQRVTAPTGRGKIKEDLLSGLSPELRNRDDGTKSSFLTHSGHGDHQEVDTVPVAQTLTVGEVRRVSGIFKLKDKFF